MGQIANQMALQFLEKITEKIKEKREEKKKQKITTYIQLIAKDKPAHRRGKVQLIDASKMVVARRKNLGNKRNDITEADREVIVKAYGEFANATIV